MTAHREHPVHRPVPLRSRVRSGFTVIELLVVIAVMAVLIAILLPALRHARILSREMVALSNLKQIGVTFEQYTAENDDTHPWHDRETLYTYTPDRTPNVRSVDPFAMRYFWPAVMHDYAPWEENFRAWVDIREQRAPGKPWLLPNGRIVATPSYFYANSFLARPSVWHPTLTRKVEPDIGHAPTRTYEVQFPSSKAFVFDVNRTYLERLPTGDDPRPILARDLSAAKRFDEDATDPVQNRLNNVKPVNYSDTLDGVRGLDW